jgi:hypothetical protein
MTPAAAHRIEIIIKRLRDERGLGDRVILARAAADELEQLLSEFRSKEDSKL